MSVKTLRAKRPVSQFAMILESVSQFAESQKVKKGFSVILLRFQKRVLKSVETQKMGTFVEKTFLDTNFRGTLKTRFWHFWKTY